MTVDEVIADEMQKRGLMTKEQVGAMIPDMDRMDAHAAAGGRLELNPEQEERFRIVVQKVMNMPPREVLMAFATLQGVARVESVKN